MANLHSIRKNFKSLKSADLKKILFGGSKINKNTKKKSILKKNRKQKIKSKKIGGGQIPGPYASLMNKASAYSRLGANGQKVWHNGYLLGSNSVGGPTRLCQLGGKTRNLKRKKYKF